RAGLEAPSGYNMQPWRFVVVRDPEQRKRLRQAAMNQPKVEQAPVMVVACGDTTGWHDDLEEVIRIGRDHGLTDEAQIQRTRKNVTKLPGVHPESPMWGMSETMIDARPKMWAVVALG